MARGTGRVSVNSYGDIDGERLVVKDQNGCRVYDGPLAMGVPYTSAVQAYGWQVVEGSTYQQGSWLQFAVVSL